VANIQIGAGNYMIPQFVLFFMYNLSLKVKFCMMTRGTTGKRAFFGGHRNFWWFFRSSKIMDRTAKNKPTAKIGLIFGGFKVGLVKT
jgi:hypothetical protein